MHQHRGSYDENYDECAHREQHCRRSRAPSALSSQLKQDGIINETVPGLFEH